MARTPAGVWEAEVAQPAVDVLSEARQAYAYAQEASFNVDFRVFDAAVQRALELAEIAGDDELLGWCLVRLAASLHNNGAVEECANAALRATSLMVNVGNRVGEARARVRAADALLGLGRNEQALDELSLAAVALETPLPAEFELAIAHATLASVYSAIGTLDPARACLHRAVGVARALDDRVLAGHMLLRETELLLTWRERAASAQDEQRAEELLTAVEDLLVEPEVQTAVTGGGDAVIRAMVASAQVELHRGRARQACELLMSLNPPIRQHDAPTRAVMAIVFGEALNSLGAREQSRVWLDEARRSVEDAGEITLRSSLLKAQADLAIADGDPTAASELYRQWGISLSRQREDQRTQQELAVQARIKLLATRQEADRFETIARYDPLTRLLNRRGLDHSLRMNGNRAGCLLVVDVDHFKGINDTFGHDTGDRVLQSLADIMRHSCRPDDLIIRYAGDEFVLVLPLPHPRAGLIRARALCALVAHHDWDELTAERRVTVSIGVASALTPEDDFATIFARADERLLEVKRSGRGQALA